MGIGSAALRMNVSLHIVPPRWLYFFMFAVSGFSGLIYESIWSHYLKLFLGHAAFAQSLVLIIFMGGMAAGAWITSRYSSRWKMPLLAYAIVEVAIGVLALVFHDVFQSVIDAFYLSILPSLGSPTLGSILKWSAAALLIFPQSMLLGMTFPLMSAGILRRYPETPGGSLAMLYFTNSIGAAIGVLASGFWLIEAVGLPGTIFTAGLLNIALAMTVWILIKLDPEPESGKAISVPVEDTTSESVTNLFLVAAFITGAASFIYEISWIRMLSLVLGSTTHSFELMLSAFITGLAFGGLWIKRRIDNIDDPVGFSGRVQILMGTAAILTLPIYAMSFEWMAGLLAALQKSDAGFTLFTFGSHLIALAVMLPATFLAGMTLPLFTFVMMKQGAGEKAIGRVYAANTFGAIVGVVFAINIGLPMLGMKNLVAFGAALDVILGLILLSRSSRHGTRSSVTTGALVGVGSICIILFGFELNQKHLLSGVYRVGNLNTLDSAKILSYEDGRTASVSLTKFNQDVVTIATNGKADAAVYVGEGNDKTPDEITMMMLGALPLAYKPDATVIGNIGMGSGLTTHTLLASPTIERVDTIEIEPKMAEAAEFGFGARVERTFNDPRSHIHIEDAKTFFSLNNRQYDVIIAEPSNPWVSGVASLFSEEFYSTITNYLVDDGLFVQWIQLYEFNDALMMSVLKALSPHFSDYAIYSAGTSDVMVIARKTGVLGEPDFKHILTGAMADDLKRVNMINADDFKIRKTAEKKTVDAMFDHFRVPANSDYFPYLDLNAGQARFAGSSAMMIREWSVATLPVLEMLHNESVSFAEVQHDGSTDRIFAISVAEKIFAGLMNPGTKPEIGALNSETYLAMRNLSLIIEQCAATSDETESLQRWHPLAAATLPYLNIDRAMTLIDYIANPACWSGASQNTRAWLDLYRAVAKRNAAAMASIGSTLLRDDTTITPSMREYVLTATMLGLIESGRSDEAVEAWTKFGEELQRFRPVSRATILVREYAHNGAT